MNAIVKHFQIRKLQLTLQDVLEVLRTIFFSSPQAFGNAFQKMYW